MEASGFVFNQSACLSSSLCRKESKPSSVATFGVDFRRRRSSLSSGFYDNGYREYYSYSNSVRFGMMTDEKIAEEKREAVKLNKKKQKKLLKGLTRDLSTFSQIGFGVDLDPNSELLHQVQGSTISEAAEILMAQLQKLKADKDLKRKQKEEKKRLKSAARMKHKLMSGGMSSSSSESSDSECGEVVNMSNLKKEKAMQESLIQNTPILTPPEIQENLENTVEKELRPAVSPVLSSTNSVENDSTSVGSTCSGKLEVCMGGKCKKSGAAVLLEEFQKVVGFEGAVSGCKCMGKCRDGPNVRVLNASSDTAGSNPLCLGVGMEDVDLIVSNFLGDNRNQLSLAPSC